VIDKFLGQVGPVSEVYNYPNQDFIVIRKDDKEALIPINDDIILRVDRETRVIEVDLPEGLMDIYL
jgi:16S rRNA processing protein RimM